VATVVGQASAAATSVAIPAHAVGDLIIVSARGTAAAPSVPAASGTVPAWQTLQSGLANSMGLTVVSFVATATTTTTGTFTNATHICVLVLRPAANKKLQTAAARSSVGNGNNTQTIIYPALTLNNGGGASTSVGVRVGTRGVAITAVGTPPSGWTNQSIQPAGASALMSVHTLNPVASNPTADTVTTTSSNAAYRAVTVEVEEVPVINDLGGVTVAGAAAVTAQADRIRAGWLPVVAGVGSVSAALAIPIPFAVDITTNQPYAGEHTVGEFLVGDEDVLAVDLQVIRMDFLDGLIAGQGSLSASLSVLHNYAIDLVGTGSLSAQQVLTRSLAASFAGAAALSAQLGLSRNLAAAIAGLSALVAQEDRTRNLANGVSGLGAVQADLTATPPAGGPVIFSAAVAGAAAVSAQTSEVESLDASLAGAGAVSPSLTVTSAAISFGCSVSGQAAITAQESVSRSLGASVVGQAALSAQTTTIKALAAVVGGTGAVTVALTRLIQFEALIMTTIPLCGEHLVGTFIVGGSQGPTSVIYVDTVLQRSFSAEISGQGNIAPNLNQTRGLSIQVGGQAEVLTLLGLRLALASAVVGKATITIKKLDYGWLLPTSPGSVLLSPTSEASGVLVPTTAGSAVLVPTTEVGGTLPASAEEDVVLVPTAERG
jgi:hypothetical protein